MNASTQPSENIRTASSQSKSPRSHQPSQSATKNLKTVSTKGKSPYLNDCYNKNGPGAVNQAASNASSAKSQRRGESLTQEGEGVTIIKKPIKGQSPSRVVDNMKVIAAIQRMRNGNNGTVITNAVIQPGQIGQHKKNKSYTHYKTTQSTRPQSKGSMIQHFHTNSDMTAWMNSENQIISQSF